MGGAVGLEWGREVRERRQGEEETRLINEHDGNNEANRKTAALADYYYGNIPSV